MNFKQEVQGVLQAGEDHHVLLDIVRRYLAQGLTAQAAYDSLEQIWREFGFDETEETSSLRDELEYVMEKVWYQGTSA